MKFSEIYNFVIPYWGDVINISDLSINKQLQSSTGDAKADSYSKRSANLSLKWNEVEEIIGIDNPYAELMIWTMYQLFHEASEMLFLQGQFQIFPKKVDKIQIQDRYFKNLQNNEWERELAGYVNDLT
jgi:hypothetical protein